MILPANASRDSMAGKPRASGDDPHSIMWQAIGY